MFLSRTFLPSTFTQDASVLVISCDEDETAANKLAALGFTVYSKELIVTGVLQQRLLVEEEAYVGAE